MLKKFVIHGLFLCLLSTQALASNPVRVAVVGGGGAGVTTTWLLDEDYDVTLYEAGERLGGHANTVEISVDGETIPVEAGFEFISEKYYPTFYNLLKNIVNVPLKEYTMTSTFYHTDGSGTVILPPIANGNIEWESFLPTSLFKLAEMGILLNHAEKLISADHEGTTLQQYANSIHLTKGFKNDFLYPFLAANWGVTPSDIQQFDAYDALKYIVEGKNIKDYTWIEVTGGTQRYIQGLAAQFQNAVVKLSADIVDIRYVDGEYIITEADGTTAHFDHLIFGTNGMQASQLLQNVPEAAYVRSFLDTLRYFKTTIAIHGDTRFMPADTDDWSIVNIRYNGDLSATTIHKPWLSPNSPVFKSWITYDVRAPSDEGCPIPSPLYAMAHYDHVIGDPQYFKVQEAIRSVQGTNNLWFVGNYTFKEDSHESAILSAAHVAQYLAPNANRLKQLTTSTK